MGAYNQRLRTSFTGRLLSRTNCVGTIHATVFIALLIGFASGGCSQAGSPRVPLVGRSMANRECAQGDRQYGREQTADAGNSYRAALRIDPKCAGAHAGLGQIALRESRLEEAAQHYREAVKCAPDRFEFAMSLADCQSKLAVTSMDRAVAFEAAIRAYRYACTLKPDNSTAALRLGLCYRYIGDLDHALTAYQTAEKLDPSSSAVHLEIGSVHEARRELPQAVAEYQEALRLDPNDSGAHNHCAAVNLELARREGARGLLARQRAVAHLRRSLEINPDQSGIRQLLSETLSGQSGMLAKTVDEGN